jgi:hypothetical protein
MYLLKSTTFRLLLLSALVLAATCFDGARANASANAARKSTSILAIEKISVFPVLYSGERGERIDEATANGLDETWWQVREELTGTGRFLVASRAFLQKNDAFQPRGYLTTGDAVILGRYVEADALMTMALKDRTLTVAVWQSSDGTLAWSQSVELHPSVLLREQVAKVARGLVREFLASFPYQATTLQDSFSKQAVSSEGGKLRVRISTAGAPIEAGDIVQWVKLTRSTLEPLFQGGAKVEVIAEGVVSEIESQRAVVNLTRVQEASQIQAGYLVNLPKEQARLRKLATPKDSATSAAVAALLASNLASESAIEPEAKHVERKSDESGPVATTLSILGSLAVILLLAF